MTAATDVSRFSDLDVEAPDLIAGLTDLDPAEFDIRWHYRVADDDVTALIGELTDVETAAERRPLRGVAECALPQSSRSSGAQSCVAIGQIGGWAGVQDTKEHADSRQQRTVAVLAR